MTRVDSIERRRRIVRLMRARGVLSLECQDGTSRLGIRLAPPAGESGATPRPAPPVPSDIPSDIWAVSPEPGLLLRCRPLEDTPRGAEGTPVAQDDIRASVRIDDALLPVTAPLAGTIGPCRAEDGAPVGYHQPLFSITPAR